MIRVRDARRLDVPESVFEMQADGAWPRGARIEKVLEEEGDLHSVGEKGVVLASVEFPPESSKPENCKYFYIVAWDDMPDHPCAALDYKLRKLEE